MPDIILESVTKSWGDVIAVKNFSLKIPDGSFMCFLGPSGCGKTTTLRMIAGLEEPNEGKIYMDDKLVYSSEEAFFVSPRDRDIGLIFQSYALWPHMTVFQNVAFGLEMNKVSAKEIKDRLQYITELIGIDDLLKRYPSELSGGQQQRVALARSLAPQPSCLLMDEPLSNLDAKLRVDMRTELKRIHSKTKQTIVYVTHDQIEALSLGTQVVIMNKGELQQIDKPMELYQNPSNIFVAEFVGTPRINMVKGEISEKDGQFGLTVDKLFFPLKKTKDIKIGQKVTMAVRPEDINFTEPGKKESLDFSIYSTLPTGADIFTRIYNNKVFFTARQKERVIHEPETKVGIDFTDDSLLIYDFKTGKLLGKTSLKK